MQATQARHEKEIASHASAYTRLNDHFEEEVQQQSNRLAGLETQLAQVLPPALPLLPYMSHPLSCIPIAVPVLLNTICVKHKVSCLTNLQQPCTAATSVRPRVPILCSVTASVHSSAELNALLHAAKICRLFQVTCCA